MIEIEEIIKKIEKGENNHNDLTYFIYSSKLTNLLYPLHFLNFRCFQYYSKHLHIVL